MNFMLLMMGGSGVRYGADIPKQYTIIDERPLFSYIIEKAEQTELIDRLVVVSHSVWLDYADEWCGKILHTLPYTIAKGGDTRSESVLNGLTALSEFASPDDVVLIHDATHPYIDPEGFRAVIDAVNEFGGATLINKNYDTVYLTDEKGFLKQVEPRELIVAGASPEAVHFGVIYDIYRNASEAELLKMTSVGAIALEHNIPMKAITTPVLNLKITYHDDMVLFKALKDSYFFPDNEGGRLDGAPRKIK